MIICKDIRHSFAKTGWALRADAIEWAPGSVTALVGPSGAGKSTLARILAGHLRPESGHVFQDARDITGKPHTGVVLVHQEDDLFPWMRLRAQVSCADPGMSEARIDELLHLVRLENTQGNPYPHQLSGGMKKRLALARALAAKPELLILDETFSALDQPTRAALLTDLRQILQSTHTGAFFITHNPEDVTGWNPRRLQIDSSGVLGYKNNHA